MKRCAACPLATFQMIGISGRTHRIYLLEILLHIEGCCLKWQLGSILSDSFVLGFSFVVSLSFSMY